MANLIISDGIAQRLKQIAEQENKPVDAVLQNLLEHYVPSTSTSLTDEYAIYTPFGGEDTAQALLEYLNAKKGKSSR